VNAPVRKMTSRDWYPMNWICLRISGTLMGGVAQQEMDLQRRCPFFHLQIDELPLFLFFYRTPNALPAEVFAALPAQSGSMLPYLLSFLEGSFKLQKLVSLGDSAHEQNAQLLMYALGL